MLTLRTTARVAEDGTLEVRIPTDLPPGEHEAVIVVGEAPAPERRRSQLADFPVREGGEWLAEVSLRREDLYGDDGR